MNTQKNIKIIKLDPSKLELLYNALREVKLIPKGFFGVINLGVQNEKISSIKCVETFKS